MKLAPGLEPMQVNLARSECRTAIAVTVRSVGPSGEPGHVVASFDVPRNEALQMARDVIELAEGLPAPGLRLVEGES